ncbi:MAG: hypothetical protein QMC90_02155 [Dehalococcoidales bacterium]|nr:hypothetical protein [Dehalococcoidales bacterium]
MKIPFKNNPLSLMGNKRSPLRASIGDSVVLRDLVSGEELHYILVSPTEVDPDHRQGF